MPWGTFTPQHIATLFLSVAVIVGLHFILRTCSPKAQTATLFVLSFAGLIAAIGGLGIF